MSIEKFGEWIRESNNIIFFGGAGTSTESNIPDFRTQDTGLYDKNHKYPYPPEVMISHSFFIQHTRDFYDFYKTNMVYKDAKPNDAHKTLAKLEEEGKLKAVITQNIDGLHQKAGSKNVLELHGSIYRNYCMECNKKYDLDYILNTDNVPKCKVCGGIVRPDVVLYQEGLDMEVLNRAIWYIKHADMLIVGGTSLVVYPAAGLVDYYNGNKLVLINRDETPYDNTADLIIHDSIGKVLKNAVER